MIESTTPRLEIPGEIRAVAERSVEQAKLAFETYMRATEKVVSAIGARVKSGQLGALDISKKALGFAEHNVLSAFELAYMIIRAKDIQDMVRMQNLFVQSQMQVLSNQVKGLGETVNKAAMEGGGPARGDPHPD